MIRDLIADEVEGLRSQGVESSGGGTLEVVDSQQLVPSAGKGDAELATVGLRVERGRGSFEQSMNPTSMTRINSSELLERLRNQTNDFLRRLETQWPEITPLERSSRVVTADDNP